MADAIIIDWLRGIQQQGQEQEQEEYTGIGDEAHGILDSHKRGERHEGPGPGPCPGPEPPSRIHRHNLKRKRVALPKSNSGGLPSPSASDPSPPLEDSSIHLTVMNTPRGKKRRTGDDGGGSPTPRAERQSGDAVGSGISVSEDGGSSIYSDTTTSTRQSRKSPTKQFGRLEVAVLDPVRLRQMDASDEAMPQMLVSIIDDIGLFGDGEAVIDQDLKDTLLAERDAARGSKKIRDKCFMSSGFRKNLSHPELLPAQHQQSPALREAVDIFEAAKACRIDRHAESDWNIFVHSRLLSLAASTPWAQPRPSSHITTRFTPCPAARITHAYRPNTGSSKMVDFALCLEPSDIDSPAKEAIERIRAALPGESINHTDYFPLRNRPISLSIESKTTGHLLSEAEVQVGVWHAAQWRMLQQRVKETLRRRHMNSGDAAKGSEHTPLAQGEEAELDSPPSMISFLPAIIVQGHDWHFVASTRDKKDTTLWVKQTFASSESVLGIYQIIRVLQYLVRWMEDVYWPWFRDLVLDLPPLE